MKIINLAILTLPIALTITSVTSQGSSGAGLQLDLLIRGGQVIDGTGNPWFYADVGIREGRIVAVGDLGKAEARQLVDATGKVVTPGFIDVHSHGGDQGGGRNGLSAPDPRYRAAPNMVAQGVTTLVVNQDGRSHWPIRAQRLGMQENGIGPNAILLLGHGMVRRLVMENDYRRSATGAEIAHMKQLVRQGMKEGAWGLSGGHEYSPMIWSTTEEIIALVEELSPWHGIYIVHERSSGTQPMWWWPSQDAPGAPTVLDSIQETIEVAEKTGVTSIQTHLKAKGANLWGASRAIIHLIERARNRGVNIWGDAYTYNTTGSDGDTVLIPRWVLNQARSDSQGAAPDFGRTLASLLENEETAEAIRRDVRHEMMRRGGAENLLIVEHPDSELVGRRLHEVASEKGLSPVELALQFQLENAMGRPGGVRLRGFSLSYLDVEAFHAQPWVMTASDAAITLPGDGLVHPRFYGNFPRKIRKFALELGIVSTEDAIRSMTSLPAQVLGLRDRGLLREGHWADVVVLDLEQIQDLATALDPHQYPKGIDHVLVNGQFVVENGQLTFALPGKVLVPREGPPG